MSRKSRGSSGNGTTGVQTHKTAAQIVSSTDQSRCESKKRIKPLARPGRILSVHNVPIAASEGDLHVVLGSIPTVEFKRRIDPEAMQPSSIVFLLFPTAKHARLAFMRLADQEVLGQVVRVNFVNGVKFQNDASIAEEEAVLERRHDETMVPRPTNGDNGRFRHESAKRSQPCVTHDKANDRLLKENMESLAKTKHTRRIIPGSFPDEDGE